MILIIDDDQELMEVLTLTLEAEGYEVRGAGTLAEGIQVFAADPLRFSTILLDLRLPDGSGIDLLPKIRELSPEIPILMITAHGDVDSAVGAFTSGATGYVKKPFRDGDLKAQIAQAVESHKLRIELSTVKAISEATDVKSLLRSRDPAMDPLLKRVSLAAQVNSNVVITGESGTGKELVARALHRFGPRKSGPFIAFNCAAMPEQLLESELFGYMRGAFTDARDNKPGLFARAHGGTLFIDEIGDAPLSIQTKLLRVLQEREFVPLGGTTPIRVDVRVVTASHKSLQDEVARGTFRQDLFYRLHVLPIQIPPLRDRPKDIVYLASIFAAECASELEVTFAGFTAGAVTAMEGHEWAGNVRELQNRVEQAMVTTGGGQLTARSLFPERAFEAQFEGFLVPQVSTDAPPTDASPEADPSVADSIEVQSFQNAKSEFEKGYLERLLTVSKGNIARAARLAAKSRTEVYSLLRKHGLNAGEFKRSLPPTDGIS